MGKRREYLQPGVRFRCEFWQDLNHVERRRFRAQRTVPMRWWWKATNHALEQIYTRSVISELVYRNNPFLTLALAHKPLWSDGLQPILIVPPRVSL